MFGKRVWRKAASDAVSWHQDESLSTTIFLLKEFGPTGFLLKEDRQPKTYKVFLGDPHTCTCGTFRKEKDLCKHICWVLLRKCRLPREHEYCFQTGLVERQILEVLQGLHVSKSVPSVPVQLCPAEEDDGTIRQKDIRDDDICPICQEELLRKRLPVAYCRYGCGNNVHVSCVKVWADHQSKSETDGMVKCPLCRENFGTANMLLELVKNANQLCTSSERERLEKHLGLPCNNCRICPVVGKCFKCTVCSYYHLCEDCFKKSSHPQHGFAVRLRRNQSWKLMTESKQSLNDDKEACTNIKTGALSDTVPEHVLRMIPVIQVRQSSQLLELGIQCRLCLQSFRMGQQVKTLPCRHKFHSGCIKTWLRQYVFCPIDWHIVYNPLTWGGNDTNVISMAPPTSSARINLTDQQNTELFVPGIGFERKERPDVSKASPMAPGPQKYTTQDTQATSVDITHTATCDSRCLSLEQAPIMASRKTMSAKTSCPRLSLSHVGGRMEGSERTSLFVGFNKHDKKAQRKVSSLNVQIRPMRLEVGGVGIGTRSSGGEQSNLDLQPTSVPITAKHERK